ncbi:hypothetical protein GJ496_007367, partial [Pomphorhynchus laevis]
MLRTTTEDVLLKYPKALHDNVVYELEDKVNMLKVQINTISDEKVSQHDRLLRLNKENYDLRNRIIVMEERLQDVEMLANASSTIATSYEDARNVIQETLSKYESVFADEKDMLLHRISKVEKDLAITREENQELKENILNIRNRPAYFTSQHSIDIDDKYNKLKEDHEHMILMFNEQGSKLEESQK